MMFSRTEDEIPYKPADEGKTDVYGAKEEKAKEPARHGAEYACEWPSEGDATGEKHELHHHSGREDAVRTGKEDESPEPGTPDFWPSAELGQDETWEPPARNKPDSSPWCEIQEDEG